MSYPQFHGGMSTYILTINIKKHKMDLNAKLLCYLARRRKSNFLPNLLMVCSYALICQSKDEEKGTNYQFWE